MVNVQLLRMSGHSIKTSAILLDHISYKLVILGGDDSGLFYPIRSSAYDSLDFSGFQPLTADLYLTVAPTYELEQKPVGGRYKLSDIASTIDSSTRALSFKIIDRHCRKSKVMKMSLHGIPC
jgi:hypothetical protein